MLRDREIDLAQYGLEYVVPDPVYHMPFADGSYITQWLDLDRTCSEIAKISKKRRRCVPAHVSRIGEDRPHFQILAAPLRHVGM